MDLKRYLKYIGITNKGKQSKILSIHKKALENQYRVSKVKEMLESTKLEEGAIDNIIRYVIDLDFRDKMNKEIEKKGSRTWGL